MVASTHQPFADLLRVSLLKSKQYHVEIALSVEEMQTLADQNSFDLAILDADLPEQPFLTEVLSLQQAQPALKLVIFPPENRATHPAVKTLPVDAFLCKPFYLPDLLTTLEAVLQNHTQARDVNIITKDAPALLPENNVLHWQDPQKLDQLLTQALESCLAQAIILLSGGKQYAYRGEMNESVAEEITAMLLHDWDQSRRSDLIRFKRLAADGKDHLIYAAAFEERLVLVVIYDKSVSLTSARAQTRQVMKLLRAQTLADGAVKAAGSASDNSAKKIAPFLAASKVEPNDDEGAAAFDEDDLEPLDEAEMIKLAELLAQMPSPDPDKPEVFLEDREAFWEFAAGDQSPPAQRDNEQQATVSEEIPAWLQAFDPQQEEPDQPPADEESIPEWLEPPPSQPLARTTQKNTEDEDLLRRSLSPGILKRRQRWRKKRQYANHHPCPP